MTVHYSDDWLTVLHGDVRDELRTLPDESVHCVVTSPPYWGLRDYGTASWEGGDPACDHVSGMARGDTDRETPGGRGGSFQGGTVQYRSVCGKCGAVRLDNQLGLEPTPEQYVENMVAVFREVRRVLRSDGTLWLNLGDSYAAGGTGRRDTSGEYADRRAATFGSGRGDGNGPRDYQQRDVPIGLKPKDLVGIPWRVAFALQADGWYLRSDIIWSKLNPMPESVTDRPTKSHEYLFLLSKSARYYFDADAVREAVEPHNAEHNARYVEASKRYGVKMAGTGQRNDSGQAMYPTNPAGRNIRSVWTIATAPYPGAHFATFPPKLVEPCIKAGTSEKGVCPECGRPWRRVTETSTRFEGGSGKAGRSAEDANANGKWRNGGELGNANLKLGPVVDVRTLSWIPSCIHGPAYGHHHDPIPATVLDPFAGSGTTGMVAQSLSRRAVLIDLNVDYLDQLMERNRDIPLGLEAS